MPVLTKASELNKMKRDADIIINSILDVKKHLSSFDAAVFDLDDTLYPEKEYVRSGYHAIAERFLQYPDMEERLWAMFCKGAPAIDEALKSYGALTDENRADCLRVYRSQNPDIRLYDGVREMLCGLKRNGLFLGMITDGRPEGQRAKISALNLESIFNEIIITDELGGVEFRKPNEKAFILMCERLGTQYSKTVYIGDNINKDFIAPQKLGMKTILFHNPDGLYFTTK